MRFYEFSHGLGLHVWDIPTLMVGVVMIIVILVHRHNQKSREE